MPPPSRPLTTRQAAELLGVAPATIVNYANAGKLRCFKLPSGQRRFHRVDVLELIESHKAGIVTAVILAACLAALGILVGFLFLHETVDQEHSLDASRRRHPSTRQPTHVRGVDRQARPYDQDADAS